MSERDRTNGDNAGRMANGFGGDVAREDWRRYGASHPASGSRAGGSGLRETDEAGRLRDDMYLDYRLESRHAVSRSAGERALAARRRRTSNLVGVGAAIAAIAVAALIFSFQASAITPPSPTASRVAHASPTASASVIPSATLPVLTTPRAGRVGVTIKMPLAVAVPDRGLDPDDGTTVYLTGPTGGIAVDPGTGRVLRVYGGPAFTQGMKRAVVDSRLWVSAWPDQGGTCGPGCWAQAATYRIDLATGNVLQTLQGTYLISAASGGVWVATGSLILRLDPDTGDTLATTLWQGTGEPRVGCEYLWSYQLSSKGTDLALIDPGSGDVIGTSSLSKDYTFGPVWADGQCWLMSGSGGASSGTTELVWLNAGGGKYAEFQFAQSLVILEREFWLYRPDGTMQRFEPSGGVPYGAWYRLDARPPGGDVNLFFASAGTLWMLSGDELVGFEVRTGTSAVAG